MVSKPNLMMINSELLAISVTIDSVVLGKQRHFSRNLIMGLSSLAHASAFALGLVLGEQLISLIGHFDHWVAFAVFGLLGVSCYKVVLLPSNGTDIQLNQFPKLLLAVMALSVDAAAVGASSKGLIEEPLYVFASIALLSPIFILLGSWIRGWFTPESECWLKFIEGSMFLLIGATIVLSHVRGGF